MWLHCLEILFNCVVDSRQDLLEFSQAANDFKLVFEPFVEFHSYLAGLANLFDWHCYWTLPFTTTSKINI